jgi:hypothetical protein
MKRKKHHVRKGSSNSHHLFKANNIYGTDNKWVENGDNEIFNYNNYYYNNEGVTAENLFLESNTNTNNTNNLFYQNNHPIVNSFENYLNNVNEYNKDEGADNNNLNDSDSDNDAGGPPVYDNILKLSDRVSEESITRLKGLFTNIICSQNGSRILQKCLKKTDKVVLSLLLDEILNNLQKMLCNPFAHLFCQKLYGCLDVIDRKRFLTQIQCNLLELSKNRYGANPIQNIVGLVEDPDEKKIILESIKDYFLEMCYVKILLKIGCSST